MACGPGIVKWRTATRLVSEIGKQHVAPGNIRASQVGSKAILGNHLHC